MTHQVFICHASQDKEIVENLADHLGRLGIQAWVYSLDRTLSDNAWAEIEQKIRDCGLFIFAASKDSPNAKGQHRELGLAMDRILKTKAELRMLPIVIGVEFGELPDELSRINGLRLDAYTVKSTAYEIATEYFPDLLGAETNREWKCPRPGQWLEVCRIDQWIEEHFDLGDRVYFRRLSPLGLFECYSPKLQGLFWFSPKNLRDSGVADEGGALERENVPNRYRYGTSIDFERIGMDEMRKRGTLD